MSGAQQSAVADAARPEPTISLGYHPALDGLRGLALLAIIVYHSQVGWAPGAFLSVSTFFTLSGFLITGLLLVEHRRTRRISLGGFWSRRLRRLMPASTVAIIVIVLGAWIFGDSTQLARLRGDALSALGYVANWRFIAAGDQYGASFASPSPFTHFWTLAIEEQFYVVLPALVTVVLAVSRGSRRVLACVFGAIIAASLAWAGVLLSHDVSLDRLYWGTDVRVVEFLSGSFLALGWTYRPEPLVGRARSAVDAVGSLALAGMLVLWATADFHNRTVYSGGLAAYSLLTLAVIFAAIQPGSVVQRLLAFRPLAWIGVVSYGAYLVHFPILTWIDAHSRLAAPSRLAVALPITLIAAGISARFLERPIRTRRRLAGPRAWIALPTALIAAVASILAVSALAAPKEAADPFADLPAIFDRDFERLAQVVDGSRAPRISSFGDSTALITGLGLLEYSIEHPEEMVSERGWSELGCSLLTDVERLVQGEVQQVPANCKDALAGWAAAVEEHPVDVAVVQVGPFDVRDQQLASGGPFLTIGEDTALDDALRSALQERVDALLEHSGMVVLLASPDIDVGRVDGRSPNEAYPESDPARMERFREILAEVADRTDGVVEVDLAEWLAQRTDERTLRPDGVHFTPETTGTVALWLVPQLLRLHEERTGSNRTLVEEAGAGPSMTTTGAGSSTTAALELPAGPAADLSEEITGGSAPFIGAAAGTSLPSSYVEHEYVASGTATAYKAVGRLAENGRWKFEPDTTAAYRTRILVRRPADAADSSGTVIVEWLNVSGGLDANPDYASLAEEIIRRGHTWVGVSAQLIGVEGGPVLVSAPGAEDLVGKGLVVLDPERYGSLEHPGDGYSFDIFTQVARAARRGGPAMGGTEPEIVLAAGESQSAIALTTYYDGVQPLTRAFDGFLVHSRAAVSLPLVAPGEYADLAGSIGDSPTILRTDLDTPVLELQAESDVVGVLNSVAARQPESDTFRLWEVAGTAHADAHLMGQLADLLDCGAPINDGPMHVVAKAALRALETWVRSGEAPPVAPRMDFSGGVTPAIGRDGDGIALGGVRTPPVDVPVDVLSGVPGPNPDLLCILLGSTKPLPGVRLAELYPSRSEYQQRYESATERAIEAGFVLEADRAALLEYADPSRIER